MKDKRIRIALNPEIFKDLEKYKDKIHYYASKNRLPMTWNEFFIILMSDWEMGRFKCNCGMIVDCDACHTESFLRKVRLSQ